MMGERRGRFLTQIGFASRSVRTGGRLTQPVKPILAAKTMLRAAGEFAAINPIPGSVGGIASGKGTTQHSPIRPGVIRRLYSEPHDGLQYQNNSSRCKLPNSKLQGLGRCRT